MKGRHRAPAKRRTRYVPAVAAGLVVFSAATAFASSLSVTSVGLGSGNGTVSSCNATASVTYTIEYFSSIPGYGVKSVAITTNNTACASKSYKVALTDSSNVLITNGEKTGTLDASGNHTADYTATPISAATVAGVSVVVTG